MDKRYALFCWKHGMASGGWGDLVELFHSRNEVAESAHEQLGFCEHPRDLFGHVVDLYTSSRIMEIAQGHWCIKAISTIVLPTKTIVSKAETHRRAIYAPMTQITGTLSHDMGRAFYWGQNKNAATLPFKLCHGLPSISVGDKIFLWGFVGTVPKNGDKTEFFPYVDTHEIRTT